MYHILYTYPSPPRTHYLGTGALKRPSGPTIWALGGLGIYTTYYHILYTILGSLCSIGLSGPKAVDLQGPRCPAPRSPRLPRRCAAGGFLGGRRWRSPGCSRCPGHAWPCFGHLPAGLYPSGPSQRPKRLYEHKGPTSHGFWNPPCLRP